MKLAVAYAFIGVIAAEFILSGGGIGYEISFTGKLQEAASLNGPFTDVSGATSPYTIPAASGIKFYRSSN